ncbi:FAD-dependent oxidoreductase [Nocardioides sp. R-C-SC26]|uniref:FAD-dependent oxidoreductase n=1 Tax=Nocardioides sp. R-C-SC26 TaxID=2870414 RepID=UPI0022B78EB0|nr:FAD-dependent oxidoreductase [Nocardioides sp. R-C-SC26]
MPLTALWTDLQPTDAPTSGSHTNDATPPTEVDVVVVGAGITGLTTALLLARSGLSVCVLEARAVGAGTTGRSTAKVTLLQGARLTSVSRGHRESVVGHYVEANREGQAWLARFCADHGVAVETRDAVSYATSSRGEALVKHERKLARRHGLDVMTRGEIDVPFPVRGAISLADQFQVDPLAVCRALADEARSHGAVVVESARVRQVLGRDPVEVRSSAGTVHARTVVVATGMPMVDRGGFFVRMSAQRSYTVALRLPRDPCEEMLLSVDSPTRSLRDAPDPASGSETGRLLLVGGAGPRPGRGSSPRSHLDQLREWAATWYPDGVETHAWSAQDYTTAHGLPVVGPVLPGAEHLLVAGGFAKWGMTNGVAAGLALTARICGGRMDWAEAFEPWSVHEIPGSLQTAALNVDVGLRMASGWMRPIIDRSDATTGDVRYEGVGAPVAVAPDDGGCRRRVSGVCPHLGGVVTWNDAEDSWDCPLHGSRFDADGAVLDGPAAQALAQR